ncbi:hypothetical protein [Sphingomonas sp.]|uniref:hypothetical protein n=1 Tax=Sphingomonas sp. TaxID=28214 RepID=UPI0025ECADA5|nr:hypothetical protein [Sphingomonas sp.]
MASEQLDYYLARAAEERNSAASAPTPAIARVHEDLAAMYDRMAREAERELELERELILAD